jgi:type III restriction enzyme
VVLPAEQQLVVFPGIELTLAVPCQALLIFDADFSESDLARVLNVLSITPADASDAEAAAPSPIAHVTELRTVHEEFDRHTWLKGRYIVLPNVTDKGHGTLLRKQMQQKYVDMPCVGAYVDGSIDKLGDGPRTILAGKDQAWGHKRVAVMQTSDARDGTFADLGTHTTWIKWAAPTAEALRQACLAQESRVAHNDPDLPSVVVTRLSVSNSKFMGPIELQLNPQYNAIIGGRGTGKSTILEYLRWALCDQPGLHQADAEIPDQGARRLRLIAQTLAPYEGHVDVHLLLNGIRHVVRRHAATGAVALRVGSGELQPATPEDVRGLLPIQGYSQKQLSSVSVRIDELTRFVTTPIRATLDSIAAREEAVAAETRESYVLLQRQRAVQRATSRDQLQLASLEQQASSLRESLGALTPADRDTLAQKPKFDSADQVVEAWTRRLERARAAANAYEAALSRLASEVSPIPSADSVAHRDLLVAIEGGLRDALSEAKRLAERARAQAYGADEPSTGLGALLDEWHGKHEAFGIEYTAATERSTAHSSKLDELSGLETRRRELQLTLDRQVEDLAGLGHASETHAQLRSNWRALQAERSAAIEAECEALTHLSGGLIRARLLRSAGLVSLASRFKAAITGSNVRAAKSDLFLEEIASAADPLGAWQHAMDELETAVLTRDDPGSDATTFSSGLKRFKPEEVERMAGQLSPEAVLELCLVPMDDHPSFEYQTKEGEYISFKDASPGQQATALLRVLLNQTGPPLIIDQPEEDLDSPVMLTIVDQIWEAKRRRQLIFTSHNANLVVNGDAELVVCCDYRAAGDQSGAQIKLKGAIDIPQVRKEITVVMEGGEKAFRLRKEKYGF